MMEIGPDAIEAAGRARFVHWAAIGARRIDPAQRDRFLQAARGARAMITCDLIAPAPDAIAELVQIAPMLDCFMPSLAEARILTGHRDPSACAGALTSLGIPLVIIKLGSAGCMVADAEGLRTFPAFKVDVMDTTSCGDAFCAGYVAACAQGVPFHQRIRFASATAALVAQGLGTLGKLQDYEHTMRAAGSMSVRELDDEAPEQTGAGGG